MSARKQIGSDDVVDMEREDPDGDRTKMDGSGT